MELSVKTRTAGKKSDVNRLRREGQVPAVLYSKGKSGEEISLDANDFKKLCNKVEAGSLSSQIFILKREKGTVRALIKDIQYHVTTYNVLHLDFMELVDGQEVELNVPIRLAGSVDCAGVKLGGVLRQPIRALKVRCLPKDIPSHFDLDVREMNIGQSKRLRDISLPATVRPRIALKEVAVVVAKK